MTNGRTSKSMESDFTSKATELVTVIESVLWKNDQKHRSQPSKVSSGDSKEETKVEDDVKSNEEIPITLITVPKDSKEEVLKSLR